MFISNSLMESGSQIGNTGLLLGVLWLCVVAWYVALSIGGIVIAYYSRTLHDVTDGVPLWRTLCSRKSLLMGLGQSRAD